MKGLLKKGYIVSLLWLLLHSSHNIANEQSTSSAPLRIAVAANFAPALKQLLEDFPNKSGINYQIISAASGTLYQQIKHGAPYDLFLSADTTRPERLENENVIVTGSRKTYAYGQLVLWSATGQLENINQLNTFSGYLAIANPNTAPYGKAAKQVLQHLSLWPKFQRRVVTGININQTFQQVRSQAVPMGIVALSQLHINQLNGITIPAHYYQPIAQQLVILKNSKQLKNAQQISDFLLQKITQKKLEKLGYLPGEETNSQGAL